MVRRRSQGCLRYATYSLYMFSNFRTGQEATVTRFCTLTDFNQDTRRVRDHMRHSLDDTVPAKMAGRYLNNEVFKIIRFQQFNRHTAFTGAHAHRQAAFLIEIADSQGHSFPSTGRQRTDGHIGENQRINPIHGRSLRFLHQLAVLDFKGQVFSGQYPAKRSADVKGMTGSVQRRVSHLGDTAHHNAVQRALSVEVGTAAPLDGAVILREQGLAGICIAHRTDGIIRANLFTHATATAEIREAGHLLDDGSCDMRMFRFRLAAFRNRERLLLHLYLDGLEGTPRYAAAAHGTALCVIFDFPRQVIDADILCFYCFHLCTSRSLSITTISRSLG